MFLRVLSATATMGLSELAYDEPATRVRPSVSREMLLLRKIKLLRKQLKELNVSKETT